MRKVSRNKCVKEEEERAEKKSDKKELECSDYVVSIFNFNVIKHKKIKEHQESSNNIYQA